MTGPTRPEGKLFTVSSVSSAQGVVSENPPASTGRGPDWSTLGFRHRGPAVPAGSAAHGLRGPDVQIR